jgi:hypothetical protein
MAMRFKAEDIYRLIKACECYQDKTGSEYMWEKYDDLKQKLRVYMEEYCPEDNVQGTTLTEEV